MGWHDSHLHAFEIGGTRYGMQFDEYPADELDEKAVTVLAAIGDTARFAYEYDFGDSWEHEIIVEGLCRLPIGLKSAVCVDGANRCPPEDCGGSGGYELLLRVLADPDHHQNQELSDWVGGPIDPTEFDLALMNARLQARR
ncbi:MAG TPA: plasmid pRiA4b ORF-3 family protein, partial [Acidimicrobiales bacterium]